MDDCRIRQLCRGAYRTLPSRSNSQIGPLVQLFRYEINDNDSHCSSGAQHHMYTCAGVALQLGHPAVDL